MSNGYYIGQRFKVGDQAKLYTRRYRYRHTWSVYTVGEVSDEPIACLAEDDEVEVLKYDDGALVVHALRTGYVGFLG